MIYRNLTLKEVWIKVLKEYRLQIVGLNLQTKTNKSQTLQKED